jgi:hypothetical protein
MSGIQKAKGIRNLDSPAQHLDMYKKFSGLEESREKKECFSVSRCQKNGADSN